MNNTERETRELYEALVPGDRVRVTHEVKVGLQVWNTSTVGIVLSKERRRHGLHFRRQNDDKVWSDLLVLELPGGERSTVSIDEFTEIERA